MKEGQFGPRHRHRPLLAAVLTAFILGSFSGAAFGVLFALSLAEQQFSRELLLGANVRPEPKAFLAEDLQVIEAVKKVAPSVVSVSVIRNIAPGSSGLFPFDGIFGMPPMAGGEPERRRVGGGTGFVISEDGMILTNRHVVSDLQAEYEVAMSDGSSYPAVVLARDAILDLAVLKVEASGLPVAEIGDASSLEIGETVIAIGNALTEYENTVTKGIVSGIGRRVIAGNGFGEAEVLEEAIQTDAAINPGNSGGPLIDIRGRVVGITSAVNRAGQSIGFAIPIDAAKLVIESVREHGRIVRAWLGVRYVIVTKETAARAGLASEHGALVVRGDLPGEGAVVPDSPAARAGIREGDILLEINGRRIDPKSPLASQIARYRPGDKVMIALLRGGERMAMQVTLGELPSEL